MSPAYRQQVERWHERSYQGLRQRGTDRIDSFGVDLEVPADVFPPTPVSDLFGRAVRAEVQVTDRVLDMGTGSGSNALLAARTATDVVAVDINPAAVACAARNAAANGLADRVDVRGSDLFANVDGRFDLILFDPPFRWFRPRDPLEAAIADENSGTLTRFMTEVVDRLRDGGRVLLSFGTSGDLDYLRSLIQRSPFEVEVLDERTLAKDGWEVTYDVYRLARPAPVPG